MHPDDDLRPARAEQHECGHERGSPEEGPCHLGDGAGRWVTEPGGGG